MRSLPYFEIIQPSSPLETRQIIAYVAKSKKPTYLRIARNEVTEFLPKNYKFKKIHKISKCGKNITQERQV